MAGTLPGFSGPAFRDAIHLVQEFFTPADSRPLFVFPDEAVTGTAVDSENVPFNPTTTVNRTPTKPAIHAPCSIEYETAEGRLENVGVIVASRIVLTLLDEDYATVRGFAYVVVDDTRYWYRSTDIPGALGTVTVWNVRCQAEDES